MSDLFDFTEALNEREAIQEDSGERNITVAFKSTEMWRVMCEARHCLDWYSLEERREYLKQVEKHRGSRGRKYLEDAIMAEWKASKAAV